MKNEDIKKAFESLSPSEEAKERMLEAILEKASAEPERAPWYIRFRPQIGAAGALAACAALFTFAAVNPQITGSRNDFVETKPSQVSQESAAVTEISIEKAVTTAVSTAITTETFTKSTAESTRTTAGEVKTTSGSAVETAAVTGAATTKATAAETTAVTTAAETKPATQSVTNDDEAVVTTVTTSAAELYGDMYEFNHVFWAGREYATNYEEVAYSSLVTNLGSGAAFSDTSDGAYTILIYEIEGVPVEKGFAVHYMGQMNYYYFYNIG